MRASVQLRKDNKIPIVLCPLYLSLIARVSLAKELSAQQSWHRDNSGSETLVSASMGRMHSRGFVVHVTYFLTRTIGQCPIWNLFNLQANDFFSFISIFSVRVFPHQLCLTRGHHRVGLRSLLRMLVTLARFIFLLYYGRWEYWVREVLFFFQMILEENMNLVLSHR